MFYLVKDNKKTPLSVHRGEKYFYLKKNEARQIDGRIFDDENREYILDFRRCGKDIRFALVDSQELENLTGFSEITPCPVCECKDVLVLGGLGRKHWMKCNDCGIEFSAQIDVADNIRTGFFIFLHI